MCNLLFECCQNKKSDPNLTTQITQALSVVKLKLLLVQSRVISSVVIGRCLGEAINYNFGKEENQKAYGTDEPPKYTDAFNAIAAPVVLWSATEDQLITAEVTTSIPNQ